MNRFASYDGTQIAVRELGAGPPLVCVPGSVGSGAYFGDLGGLDSMRRLVLADRRGTGESGDAADPGSYRCDRLVADVEALHAHLGFAPVDLLGHSAGANLAVLYAAAHPERISRLILLAPSLQALGITVTAEQHAAAGGQNGAPGGEHGTPGRRPAAAELSERARLARRRLYSGDGIFDPPATATALARLDAPVLLYGGDLDVIGFGTLEQAAALFSHAMVIMQENAGHYPWADDRSTFAAALSAFLG